MRRWKQRIRQRTSAGFNIAHTGEGDINFAPGPDLDFLGESYKAEALAVLPERLLDRESEQSELIRLTESDGYAWYQAPPWAGKSALMSWLVANPPSSASVVCFFANSRIPGGADNRAFIRAMIRQLAGIIGLEIGFEISEEARSGQLTHLLSRAAEAVNSSGQRLVIVVDGLDEDQGQSPSIAYALPRRLPKGVRVIVSSRPYPMLPPDVPGDHPLRYCERRTLEPSPHATRIRDDAAYEIGRQLTIGSHRGLIALMVAAGGGGLSSSDLAELTGTYSRASITDLMRTAFARIIDALPRSRESVWILAHDMLLETAGDRLTEELPRYLKQINQWAYRYRQERWPANTPDYLLHSYTHMLLNSGDLDRAVDLAVDRQRHELMLDRTSTDALALDEIAAVQHYVIERRHPDLRSLAVLAFHTFTIGARSAALPESLPSLWAELGDLDRGEALARTIVWPEDRAMALIDVAFTMASVDTERAAAVCASAQAVIPHIDRTGGRVSVLTGVAAVLASFDADRGDLFATSLTDPRTMALALAEVAAALTDTDPERAVKLCEKAAKADPPITDDYYPLDTWTEPAKVLASIDPDRADALARRITKPQVQAAVLIAIAEVLARTNSEHTMTFCARAQQLIEASAASYYREDALARLAAIVAAIDLGKGKKIAESIDDPRREVEASINVAVAAIPHSPRQAEEFALSLVSSDSGTSPLTRFASALALSDPDRAEELAYTIDNLSERALVLVKVMTVIGRTSSVRALKICEIVESLAHSISGSTRRASLLTDIAAGIGTVSREKAIRLCEMAEQAARHSPDFLSIGCVVSKVAAALARVEPDRAMSLCRVSELIANNLVDASERDFVLAEFAVALAAIEPDRAIRVLDSITDGDHYAHAVPRAIEVIARIDRSRIIGLSQMVEYVTLYSDEDLGRMLETIAHVDFERAKHIANSIPNADPLCRVIALTRIAASVLEVSPQEAFKLREQAAQSLITINDPYKHAVAVAWIACAFAPVDQDRASHLLDEAEKTAYSITSTRHREMTLAHIVYPMAIADAVRAQRICESLVEEDWRAHALTNFCRIVAEGVSAGSDFVRSALASLLTQTEYDFWGGDWTSSLNPLAVTDPQAITAIADELDSELAQYPELAELFET